MYASYSSVLSLWEGLLLCVSTLQSMPLHHKKLLNQEVVVNDPPVANQDRLLQWSEPIGRLRLRILHIL